MKTIWKFILEVTDVQELELPKNYEIISLQVQHGVPCIWVLLNPEEFKKEKVNIITYGTGNIIINDNVNFVGSYQLQEGAFLGHVFIEK